MTGEISRDAPVGPPRRPRAITLDLDDTLWPVWPAIDRAESVLHGWLRKHAPRTAERYDTDGLRDIRVATAKAHPEQAHDLSWLRRASIETALRNCDEDPTLAGPAFELFFDHRQRVALFDEVPAALARLSAQWPILALTNGNADLERIGLAGYFVGMLGARSFGVGKPHAAFFHAACSRLQCDPSDVLHIGDDWALDIEGAWHAGMPSVWVRRDPASGVRPGAGPAADTVAAPWVTVSDMARLADWLETLA
jgi:FMN hydrolase / 5-amino-6-(5-phospho-D-ribitylamino)uracil phosphatase